MKGFTRDKKFVPMTDYKKVTRKSRDPKAKTQGVRMKRTNVSSIKAGDKCFCGRTSVKGGLCPSCRDMGVFFEKQKIEQAQRNPKNVGAMERKERDHEHNLKPYWGGWYCPNCTTGKFAKMEGNMQIRTRKERDFTESDKLTALELIERKPDTTADHLSESTDIGGLDNEDAILEIDRILNILLREGKITVDDPNAEFPKYRITARGSKQKEIQRLQEKAMAIGKQRVDSMISGTPEETKALWEKEKQAHIELASLEGRTLREGFAES